MFWIWVCFGVGIDKRWNFNGCGDFCGGDFGGWSGLVGWLEGLVLLGRAWVSSLPIFFLEIPSNFGNYPHISA